MEIEFNTSRIAERDSSQPVARRDIAPAAADAPSFPSASSLEGKLSDLSTVRPDKVELAKSLVANPLYPPTDLIERIATLMAITFKS